MRMSDWSSDLCSSYLGIDVDAGAMRNYQKMTGHPGTVLDLFSLEPYRAWNDNDPPPGWKEATPLDIWLAFGRETPDVLFLSAHCKGDRKSTRLNSSH